MRPLTFTLPLSLGLAAVGVFLLVSAQPKQDVVPVASGPKHPVSEKMQADVDAMSRKLAPEVLLTSADGTPWNLGKRLKNGPVFLYFILDGCPCSIEAEPLYHRLAKNFEGKAEFVGVITSPQKVAAKWVDGFKTPYPVACDDKGDIAKAFGAERSAYSAIIRKDGTIDRMWAGYSKSMLEEANTRLAALTEEPVKPLDTAYAPKELSSGCSLTEGVGK